MYFSYLADEALRVELFSLHGRDDPPLDPLATDAALDFCPGLRLGQSHLLHQGAAEHVRHVFFLERLPQLGAYPGGDAGAGVANLNVAAGKPEGEIG